MSGGRGGSEMPLQNRVAPDGSLHAVPERGLMLGNRGGKFHRPDKTLGKRRWATHHWICCELHYKGMHHEAMGEGYTSLFFLDEVTALAAGHRPCFYCRRAEAKAFLGDVRVDAFDRQLHKERLASPSKRSFGGVPEGGGGASTTPDATMFSDGQSFFAKRNTHLLRWSFGGYVEALPFNPAMRLNLLTPPSITAILRAGYKPRWHPSASQWDNTQ